MVRSRPQRHPSCLQNTTTLYRHLTAAGSWQWYDHGHDGTPRVCRIQLHCTDTLQLQILGNGTITAKTAPLVFVEYNYIVPTPYSCRFLGVVRSRPRRPPLVFVEYNYIVPTPYSCRFLGVVRSRPQRPPSCLQNTTTLYRHLTAAGSWERYDHGHDGPLVFIEYNYIVSTPYSCRFLGVVRSRPRRPPSCLQNTTTLYRHLTAAGSWEWYDHNHDGTPRVCRIQLHCTDTSQLQVIESGTITSTTAPLVFVEYNYIVPTPYSCRFLVVVRSRPRRHPSCLQNTTTLYRHYTIQLHVPTSYSCRFLGMVRSRPQRHPSGLQNTTTLYRHFTTTGSWEWYDYDHDGSLVFVEYNYIVPTP